MRAIVCSCVGLVSGILLHSEHADKDVNNLDGPLGALDLESEKGGTRGFEVRLLILFIFCVFDSILFL